MHAYHELRDLAAANHVRFLHMAAVTPALAVQLPVHVWAMRRSCGVRAALPRHPLSWPQGRAEHQADGTVVGSVRPEQVPLRRRATLGVRWGHVDTCTPRPARICLANSCGDGCRRCKCYPVPDGRHSRADTFRNPPGRGDDRLRAAGRWRVSSPLPRAVQAGHHRVRRSALRVFRQDKRRHWHGAPPSQFAYNH